MLEAFSKHSYNKLNKLLKDTKDITIFVHVLFIVQVIIHLWKSNLEFFSSSKIIKTKNLHEYKVLKLNAKKIVIKYKVAKICGHQKKGNNKAKENKMPSPNTSPPQILVWCRLLKCLSFSVPLGGKVQWIFQFKFYYHF